MALQRCRFRTINRTVTGRAPEKQVRERTRAVTFRYIDLFWGRRVLSPAGANAAGNRLDLDDRCELCHNILCLWS